MPTVPLVQDAPFDVAGWEPDAQFAVFPQGARAKDAVFAPDPSPNVVLIGGRRYLFKHSRRVYPDQFWAEVVAYRVGCLLGVQVPPAFAAWNSGTGVCGALIEWFYSGQETSVLGGDFLQRIRPDYDRAAGSTHNMADNELLLRVFSQARILETDWRQWWADAFLFDALIGNSDRHQDNWSLIFWVQAGAPKCRISPLFDNGTSLGHELFVDRVNGWSDVRLETYVARGRHHVKWTLDQAPRLQGHSAMVAHAFKVWPDTRKVVRARLHGVTAAMISEALSDLPHLDIPVRLTAERLALMLRLLKRRLLLLQTLV